MLCSIQAPSLALTMTQNWNAYELVATDFMMPNGLAFSPNESQLYVIDTGSTHVTNGPNHIRQFQVADDNTLHGTKVFANNIANGLDGLRIDTDGRLWCSAEDGVHCYHRDGTLLDKIILPSRAGNLCFGESDWQTLFICASDTLFRLRLAVQRCTSFVENFT